MQDDNPHSSLWAVAYTSNLTIVGIAEAEYHPKTLPEVLALHQAVGLKTDLVPLNTPQGPAFTLVQQLYPLAGCQNPVSLTVRPTALIWFSDMEESDRARHKLLVDQLMQQLQAVRAQRAGIMLAGPGEMPLGRRTS